MEGFYVSIIFVGIMLVFISFAMIAYDRKKTYDYTKLLDEKKQDLIDIISDAEQMVEEMNKFSDYIVTKIDLKNEELCTLLKNVEGKTKKISIQLENIDTQKNVSHKKNEKSVVEAIEIKENVSQKEKLFDHNSDLVIDNNLIESAVEMHSNNLKHQSKSKDKIIPLNSRHKEVIQLVNKGMNSTEIARKLNIGKGEIELIIGINKSNIS